MKALLATLRKRMSPARNALPPYFRNVQVRSEGTASHGALVSDQVLPRPSFRQCGLALANCWEHVESELAAASLCFA